MAEQITLTTPQQPPSTTFYSLESLFLDVANMRVSVNLLGQNGERVSRIYDSFSTPTGAQVLHAINTGNFSVTSLVKTLYNRLITDNVIAGTVTGTVT